MHFNDKKQYSIMNRNIRKDASQPDIIMSTFWIKVQIVQRVSGNNIKIHGKIREKLKTK